VFERLFRDAVPSPMDHLEPRALLAADLMIVEHGMTTSRDAQQNVVIKLPLTVYNRGGGIYTGGGNIEFYLSTDREFSSDDYLFATMPLPRLGFPGSSGRVVLNARKPATLAPNVGQQLPEGDYHVIARIAPADPSREADPSNNIATTDQTVGIRYAVGSSAPGAGNSAGPTPGTGNTGATPGSPLTVNFGDGSSMSVQLTGPGSGQLVNVDNRVVLVLTDTDHRTVVRLTPLKGSPTLGGIRVDGNIKDILAQGVNVDGDIDIAGAVGQVTLGNLSNSNFIVRGFSEYWTATLGHVRDSSITSNFSQLLHLNVASWTDTGGELDVIRTPLMDTLNSAGDFGASLKISGSKGGFAVRQIRARDLTTGQWNLNGGIERMDVRDIDTWWAGNIRGSIFYLNISRNASGTLATYSIRRIIVGGDMHDATYLIGANLGDDARLGGTGINADQFAGGRVSVLEIRGRMENSIFASSLGTVDDILLNEDDRLVPGQGNQIDSITIRRGMFNSTIVAPGLPQRASINFRPVITYRDPRFISELPL